MYIKVIVVFLLLTIGKSQANEVTFEMPSQFAFGQNVEQVKLNLSPMCSAINVINIVPITAPLAKQSQQQINCAGFMYGGKKRQVELVFQDNQLDIVWILFPKEEKQTFITNFKALHGEPTMEVGYGTIFLQANAAIRNEPSEVLFASIRQVKVMMNKLKQQLAQANKQQG